MAAVSCVLSEDQLLCCICLEVFNDPVSTSCGHSFCKTCIYHHWDHSEQYRCPVCKEDFKTRPVLKTNTFASEMVSHFRSPREQPYSEKSADPGEPGPVFCDVCCEPRLRALKSCLVCLASYCHAHLEPHLITPRLQRHQLICPVENLEERICHEHDKPLELLCQKEKTLICLHCASSEHKEHTAIPLREECERQQKDLETLIAQRQQKIQEIQDSIKVNTKNADQEMAEGVKVFTALMEIVQKSLYQFIDRITRNQEKVKDRAVELIEELEQEICVLKQRVVEMEQALVSEDHFSFIQTFLRVKPAPKLENWTDVTVSPWSYNGLVAQAVSKMEKTLLMETKMVFGAELRRLQQFEVNVTLDPDTAHPNLVLSDNNKQVHYRKVEKNYPELPQRFCLAAVVLGKEKQSSGASYFQVQVTGKTDWVLGVAKESVNRKAKVTVTPENGYWTIRLRNDGQYKANGDHLVPLSPKSRPDVIGVYVDYEKGVVSFYDVDTADLLYSFHKCSFSGNVLPILAPQGTNDGKNVAPLIITPVKMYNK